MVLDRFWVGAACLSVFEGAFTCEAIRAGILSVARGQWEESDSIGLVAVQGNRYVILPHQVPLMLRPLTGLIILLIENSATVDVWSGTGSARCWLTAGSGPSSRTTCTASTRSSRVDGDFKSRKGLARFVLIPTACRSSISTRRSNFDAAKSKEADH